MTVELRVPGLEDAAALGGLFAEFERAYGLGHDFQHDLESWLRNPGMDLERDARVALRGEEIVGYAAVSDAARDGTLVYLDVRSNPAHRERADPALLDFALQRAAELAAPEGVMKVEAPKDAASLRALIEERGFALDHYSFRMGVDVSREPPPPEWPAGISVRSFRRDVDTEAVYEAHQEAFAEEPDFFRDPFDEWQRWGFRTGFDPDLWFLAFDGDEVAGICLSIGADERVGWVNILGVRKPWRRRGLGRALLLHAFHELRARGKKRVGLGVDGINERALSLYRNAGMEIERTSAWYRRDA